MQIRQIIDKAFEEGKAEVKDIGTFIRKEIKHRRKVGNNVTRDKTTVIFKLNDKLVKYESKG